MITGAAGEACSRYNVWISAFRFKGKPLELILKALEGEVEIFISQGIIDETCGCCGKSSVRRTMN